MNSSLYEIEIISPINSFKITRMFFLLHNFYGRVRSIFTKINRRYFFGHYLFATFQEREPAAHCIFRDHLFEPLEFCFVITHIRVNVKSINNTLPRGRVFNEQ